MMRGIQVENENQKVFPLPYYRVGDLYLTTRSENPSIIFGGQWQLYGAGRTIVCVDINDSSLNKPAKTGGSINPLTYHHHNFEDGGRPLYWDSGLPSFGGLTDGNTVQYTWNAYTKSEGDNTDHNNWQPFITCYIWIRVA